MPQQLPVSREAAKKALQRLAAAGAVRRTSSGYAVRDEMGTNLGITTSREGTPDSRDVSVSAVKELRRGRPRAASNAPPKEMGLPAFRQAGTSTENNLSTVRRPKLTGCREPSQPPVTGHPGAAKHRRLSCPCGATTTESGASTRCLGPPEVSSDRSCDSVSLLNRNLSPALRNQPVHFPNSHSPPGGLLSPTHPQGHMATLQ